MGMQRCCGSKADGSCNRQGSFKDAGYGKRHRVKFDEKVEKKAQFTRVKFLSKAI